MNQMTHNRAIEFPHPPHRYPGAWGSKVRLHDPQVFCPGASNGFVWEFFRGGVGKGLGWVLEGFGGWICVALGLVLAWFRGALVRAPYRCPLQGLLIGALYCIWLPANLLREVIYVLDIQLPNTYDNNYYYDNL